MPITGKKMTGVVCPLCNMEQLVETYDIYEDDSESYKVEGEEINGRKFYCESCERWIRIPPKYKYIKDVVVRFMEEK